MNNAREEKSFMYKGYECAILMMPMGHRCGYVGLPADSKLWGEDYDNLEIECHGGLTYSSDDLQTRDTSDKWWIGFDCAHFGDAPDYTSAMKIFGDCPSAITQIMAFSNPIFQIGGGEIRTLDFCIDECKNIVDQIIEIENE